MISYIREREYAIKLYYCYTVKYSKVHQQKPGWVIVVYYSA